MLAEDKLVGWFQGRMESGPRALGNRSILVNPMREENKDRLNAYVKFREPFRPFCRPCDRLGGGVVERARPERFMITSFDAMAAKRATVPAVIHVDGTVARRRSSAKSTRATTA